MYEELAFYSTHGPITTMASIDERLLADLPAAPASLCGVSNGLIVHEFLAGNYGVEGVEERAGEVENRTATEMVATIVGLDPRPLVERRRPERRMIGNCRHFTVLTCALLRNAGIPARARPGFAAYFDETWVDHWVVERWDQNQDRWIRTDAQLDEVQKQVLGYDFDPMDLPPGRFLSGSEAWKLCRKGDEDPERFGIMDMRGLWFVAASAIRDLAAHNKVETHTWDTWGVMDSMMGELEPGQIDLVDSLVEVITEGSLSEVQVMYRQPGIEVPAQVTSHRSQRLVSLPLD